MVRTGKKIFLISPVRKVKARERMVIAAYASMLEGWGYRVHWPERDTPQDDTIGLDICEHNQRCIVAADEVHIWYNKASQGSIFDFGMAFALGKKLIIANKSAIEPTPRKSFENVLLAYAQN